MNKKSRILAIFFGCLAFLALSAQSSLSTQGTLYGNAAAKADNSLTVESMLTYAIQDEYLARAEYAAIMGKFGIMEPYSNIKDAEEQHIAWLKEIFASLGIPVPADQAALYIHIPATLKEAAETGVQAEIDNIAMYERFLTQSILKDPRYKAVADIFVRLRDASKNHLVAFQRQLAKY